MIAVVQKDDAAVVAILQDALRDHFFAYARPIKRVNRPIDNRHGNVRLDEGVAIPKRGPQKVQGLLIDLGKQKVGAGDFVLELLYGQRGEIVVEMGVVAKLKAHSNGGFKSLAGRRVDMHAVAKQSGGGVEIISEERLQSAQSRPLTETELITCFEKTDGLPLQVRFEEIDIKGNIFIPKSKLNALRRNFYEKLTENQRVPYAYEQGREQQNRCDCRRFFGSKSGYCYL